MERFPSQKRMTILLWIIVVLLLLAAYYYIVYPEQRQIRELKSEISSERTFIKIATTKQGDGSEVKVAKRQEAHTIPLTPSTDQLLLDLHQAEKRSKSSITELVMKSEDESRDTNGKKEGPIDSFSYVVTVQSPDYPSIYEFIGAIENSKRVYVVEELNLPGQNGKEETPFEYKLEVKTFYQK